MITIRRNAERRHVPHEKRDIWHTFHPEKSSARPSDDLGVLAAFDEIRLQPGQASPPPPDEEAEIVTYVYRGAIAQEDSTGNSGVVHAGEFQRMTIGNGVRHKERNGSSTDAAHLFRISLRPTEVGLVCVHQQKRFVTALRRNVLCVVASQDGRRESLRIPQDALVYSSMLDPGHHLIHQLLPGRSAWLHVIDGEATLHDNILIRGDGAGVTGEPAVSSTAQESTEILLVDFGPTSTGPRPVYG